MRSLSIINGNNVQDGSKTVCIFINRQKILEAVLSKSNKRKAADTSDNQPHVFVCDFWGWHWHHISTKYWEGRAVDLHQIGGLWLLCKHMTCVADADVRRKAVIHVIETVE